MRVDSARHVRSAHEAKALLRDGLPQIAFVGRSNVGKSSLLNRLLGRKGLARTSSTPGRTRAVHYFLINSRLYFVDLPGYGYAKVSKQDRRQWAALMDRYFRQGGGRIRVIQLVDAKVGATPLDEQAFDYLSALDCRPAVVATRADRVARGRRRAAMDAIAATLGLAPDQGPIAASARTGEGMREVWKTITGFLDSMDSGRTESEEHHG